MYGRVGSKRRGSLIFAVVIPGDGRGGKGLLLLRQCVELPRVYVDVCISISISTAKSRSRLEICCAPEAATSDNVGS